MKISEVKNTINEEVDQEVLQKLKNAIRVYSQTISTTNRDSDSQEQPQSQSGNSRSNPVRKLASEIRSGKHEASKQLDDLVKQGSDRQIRSFIINAGNNLAEKMIEELNVSPNRHRIYRQAVPMRVRAALTGYANKKYLGGSATNFKAGKGFWGKVIQAAGGGQQSSAQNRQQPRNNQNQQGSQRQNTQQQKSGQPPADF